MKGKDVMYRRVYICDYFKEKATQMFPEHKCCDVCQNACDCEDCRKLKEQRNVTVQYLPFTKKNNENNIAKFGLYVAHMWE